MQLPYKFGRYALISKIAEGGMAEVYRGKFSGEGGFVKDVAIKRILPVWSDSRDFIRMLCDEAKALVHLQHQNIVSVYELGKDGNAFYISMEYVDGVDLRRLIRREQKAIPVKYACFIIGEILKGIDFAHNRKDKHGRDLGIIHRDISPQNVLVSYNGEVKVADFGIAKGSHRTFETATTQVKGKYAYMSPEQAKGETIDARSDIYSIGVVFYELLTLRRLYDAPNDLLTIEEVKRSALPREMEELVPIGLRPIIRRALQKNANDRYGAAKEMLADLNLYISANKLMTHGIELSGYVKELFRDEFDRSQREDTCSGSVDLEVKKHETMVLSRAKKQRMSYRWPVLSAAVVVCSVCAGIIIYQRGAAAPIVTQAVAPVVLKVPSVSAPMLPTPAVVAEPVKPQEQLQPSLLNIQARPWGFVYIPGVVQKKETPVRGLKMKPGDYVIKVNFEPDNKWAERRITLAENSRTTCIADFSDSAKMKCVTNK